MFSGGSATGDVALEVSAQAHWHTGIHGLHGLMTSGLRTRDRPKQKKNTKMSAVFNTLGGFVSDKRAVFLLLPLSLVCLYVSRMIGGMLGILGLKINGKELARIVV